MTDPLTGLPNRRAFKAAIDRGALEPREDASDCIAVFDIDHFKVVNDSFGHDAGDEVLRSFAAIRAAMVREGDSVARIGGEEFAIFFPRHVGRPGDRRSATACAREMARADLRSMATDIRVTVSGGVALVGPRGARPCAQAGRSRALHRQARRPRPDGAGGVTIRRS